jgi:hypothetical protein
MESSAGTMFLVPGKLGKRTPRLFRLSAEDHAIIITKSEESSLEIARLPLEELMTVTLAQDEVDHELRVELGTRWSTMRLTAVAGGAGDPRAFVEAIAAATAAGVREDGQRPLGVHETVVKYNRYESDADASAAASRGRDDFREIWGGKTMSNRHRRAS